MAQGAVWRSEWSYSFARYVARGLAQSSGRQGLCGGCGVRFRMPLLGGRAGGAIFWLWRGEKVGYLSNGGTYGVDFSFEW